MQTVLYELRAMLEYARNTNLKAPFAFYLPEHVLNQLRTEITSVFTIPTGEKPANKMLFGCEIFQTAHVFPMIREVNGVSAVASVNGVMEIVDAGAGTQ